MTQTQSRKKNLFQMNVDLMHGPIFRSLVLFMLPILISNLFQQLYNTVDTMIVGNVLGDTALAAIGSCGAIYELLVGFGLGIGNGLAIVAARAYGAQDEDLLKRTVAGSLVIGLCASFVITTAGFFGLRPLLELESGSNDPMAYMMTILLISVVSHSSGSVGMGIRRRSALRRLLRLLRYRPTSRGSLRRPEYR